MLICTPGKRDERENAGNVGTTVRYNISRNDHSRAFNISGGEHITIDHNVVYAGPEIDLQMVAVTNWSGWASDVVFRDNVFWALGTARYGHEVKRNKDGTYDLAPGWGPAEGIVFEGNRFIGPNVDCPDDPKGTSIDSAQPPEFDWHGPEFDPADADRFDAFLVEHRKWITRLLEQQFGVPVKLGRQ